MYPRIFPIAPAAPRPWRESLSEFTGRLQGRPTSEPVNWCNARIGPRRGGAMFQKGYLLNELRRRWGRTIVTSLGLAVGVGLVIGIIGVSQGLSKAQNSVLS